MFLSLDLRSLTLWLSWTTRLSVVLIKLVVVHLNDWIFGGGYLHGVGQADQRCSKQLKTTPSKPMSIQFVPQNN